MDATWSNPTGIEWPILLLLGAVLLAALLGGLAVYGVVVARLLTPGGRRVVCEDYGPVEFGVAAALVAWFGFLLVGGAMGGVNEPPKIDLDMLLVNAAVPAALCLAVIVALKWRRHSLTFLFGWGEVRCAKAVLWGLGLLLAAYPILLVLAVINFLLMGGEMEPQSLVRFMRQSDNLELQVAVILLAVVVAPLSEEFLFRGFLYGVAKRYFGVWPAVGFSSALFAAIHLHPPSMLPLAGLAVCLCLAYEVSGSLLVPMTMHALFNTASLAAVLFLPETG